MKDRRLGVVAIHDSLFRDEHIKDLAEIFSIMKAVAIQINWHFDTNLHEYMLYSPMFDVVEEGAMAPSYKIEIQRAVQLDGNMTIEQVSVLKLPNDSKDGCTRPRSRSIEF